MGPRVPQTPEVTLNLTYIAPPYAIPVCPPYLVRLTERDLSLVEGPFPALPAHPEERRSPWT